MATAVTKYLNKSFAVPYGSAAYRDNWDKNFNDAWRVMKDPSSPHWIEACVKCLGRLDADHPGRQIEVLGGLEWFCADEEGCARRQKERQAVHQQEIARRVEYGVGRHTHLVVVQDKFGALFGYGNVYIGVEPGDTPQEALDAYLTKQGWTMDELVVEKIISIPEEP